MSPAVAPPDAAFSRRSNDFVTADFSLRSAVVNLVTPLVPPLQMNHFLPISIFSFFFNFKKLKIVFFLHLVVTQLPSEPVSIFRLIFSTPTRLCLS